MRKLLIITAMGLALSAVTGCSSSSTPAATNTQKSDTQTSDTQKSDSQKQNNQNKRQGQGQFNSPELLSLLKVDTNTLQDELKAGKSLADVASEKGVAEQQVIDLLVKQNNARIDQQVKDGKLTQDKADTMKSKEPDRIKNMVEHKGGMNGQQRQQGKQKDTSSNGDTNNSNG